MAWGVSNTMSIGINANDALLRVIAPTGSSVTIAKGQVSNTLTAGHTYSSDETIEVFYFAIRASQFDSVNAWNVTATRYGESKTKTVTINAANIYELSIYPKFYLVKNGVTQVGNLTAVGMKTTSSASLAAVAPEITYESSYIEIGSSTQANGAGIAYFGARDVTPYGTAHFDGTVWLTVSNTINTRFDAWYSIGTYQSDNSAFLEPLITTTASSYVSASKDVDISTISGTVYIGFNIGKTSGSQRGSIHVENVYLEE